MFTDSRITDVFTCHQCHYSITSLTQVHAYTFLGQIKNKTVFHPSHCSRIHGSRMSWAEKNKSLFSNLANVHRFTDSRMSSLVISSLKLRVFFTRAIVHRFTLVIGRLGIRLNAVVRFVLVRTHTITLTSVTAVLQKKANFP